MKTKLFLLSMFLAAFVACTNEDFELAGGKPPTTRAAFADLRVAVSAGDGSSLQDVFRVTRRDLENYLAKTPMEDGRMSAKCVRDISPVVYYGDTIMYFVRYGKGWTLHAADKRMTAVLAVNYDDTEMDARTFIGRKAIEPWITGVREELEHLRTCAQYDEKSASLKDWARIDGRMRVCSEEGELDYVWIHDEIISSVTHFHPHIMAAAWHQMPPFNAYTPYMVSNQTERCPVGCVAVALGQFLYHMHTVHGFAMRTPAAGSCVGNWQNYTQTFWAMSDTLFSQMALTDNYNVYNASQFDKAALMLGYIGKGVHMSYGDNGSGASLNSALAFLSSIGMATRQGSVTEANLLSNLQRGYPVILAAYTSTNSGHMWVCDGYKYDHQIYDEVYALRTDTAPGVWRRDESTWVRVRQERDTNYYYQMNWGWDEESIPWMSDVDDTYYFLLGNWRGYNYNRRRISYI